MLIGGQRSAAARGGIADTASVNWKQRIGQLPAIRGLRKLAREAHGYGLALRYGRRAPRQQFLLLCGGRRGSHLLIELLNSHPGVHCDGELLHLGRVRCMLSPTLYLCGHRRRHASGVYGFKVSVRQLEHQALCPRQFLRQFVDQGGRIIYLVRENHLRVVVSATIAHARGKNHETTPNALEGRKFCVDCRTLASRLDHTAAIAAREKALLDRLPHLRVVYEHDLLESVKHQPTADRIFAHLGLASAPVTTRLCRTNPDPLSERISNYEEVAATLRNTSFARFLDNEQLVS